MTTIDHPTFVQTTQRQLTQHSAVREALRDVSPFVLAVIPFSLAIGATSAGAGLSFAESMFGAISLLAGSAQLAGVESIRAGSGIGVTVVVVLLVNARFAFYGAGLARWFIDAPRWQRFVLALPLIDQTFLLCQERFSGEVDVQWRVRYYTTATLGLVMCFAGCQILGYTFGGDLPPSLGLHLAAPLAFAGMLAKSAKGRPAMTAASLSSIVLIATSGAIGTMALPVAVLVGVIGGALADTQKPSRDRTVS